MRTREEIDRELIDRLVTAAIEAAERGDRTYTPTLVGGRNSHAWGPQIDAVERAGWTLQHWAVGTGGSWPLGMPIFRRITASAPTRPDL